MKYLMVIFAPHYTASCIIENNKAVECAPIIKWMKGKLVKEIQEYCRYKHFDFELSRFIENEPSQYEKP
jgi:hypothetical protein